MPSDSPIRYALKDVVAEIVWNRQQGYLPLGNMRLLLLESGCEAGKIEYSQVGTERQFDSSDQRSLHS